MKKLLYSISFLLLINTLGYGQKEERTTTNTGYFVKGGIGTSWIIMPKVFILNPADTSSAQILPATNSFTGFIGFQTVIPLGKSYAFAPEINISYIAGDIKVDRTKAGVTSQKLQSYTRIELPLNFGVISSDNFWVSFGPVLFFTLSDNKGFDEAVEEVINTNPPPAGSFNLNSDNPIGLRFRAAAYISVSERMYVDIKFDSDLRRDFYYSENDNTYNMKMSLQSVTIGFGYRLNSSE